MQRVPCDDYKKVTVHFHDETTGVAHNTTANITTLSDGRRRLVAYFSNLPENRQYQATSRVHYNQITLHSNKVQTSEMFSNSLIHYDTSIIIILIMQSSYLNILLIGTYDIWRVNYTIQFETLLLTVHYVEGSESHQFYVELQCVSLTIQRLFNGSVGYLHHVPPNEQCTLLVTDADSMSFINLSAAVIIENIAVSVTATTSIISITITQQATTPTSWLKLQDIDVCAPMFLFNNHCFYYSNS